MSQNIYQIYNDAGKSCPFLIRRTTWANWIAQVISIGGLVSGRLPGTYPYYGSRQHKRQTPFRESASFTSLCLTAW